MKYLKYYEVVNKNQPCYYVHYSSSIHRRKVFNDLNSAIKFCKNLSPNFKSVAIFKNDNYYSTAEANSNFSSNEKYLLKWKGFRSYWDNCAKENCDLYLKYLTGVKGYYEDILKLKNPHKILNEIRIDNPKLWDLLKQYVDPNEMDDFVNLNELGI